LPWLASIIPIIQHFGITTPNRGKTARALGGWSLLLLGTIPGGAAGNVPNPSMPVPVVMASAASGIPGTSGATTPLAPPPTVAVVTPPADAPEELAEIVVQTGEPRFVAPTMRDRIGRIWAPVFINGRGPFRLVLDTGASNSAVTAQVATALGIPLNESRPVMLRGVTGAVQVPTIKVKTLSVGDLSVDSSVLPIVPDALGGAEGILGSAGMSDKRIFIDFRHDQIIIKFSRGERAGRDFVNIPFQFLRGRLIVVEAFVGQVPTKAIIDTGGQVTIANLALRDALARRRTQHKGTPDQIVGATLDVLDGEIIATPAIELGTIRIRDSGVTYADAYIFGHWKLTAEPAILIGMDALGLLDTLIIDYRRHELLMRTANGG
jgi:Aspartyl protease